MAVTTTNLGVITAYGDAVAAGYTGTKAEWQTLMASYATVAEDANDAKNDAVAAKDTAVAKATEATTAAATANTAKDTATSKATEATTAANIATTKAGEASASAQSIAQSASQIAQNTSDINELKEDFTTTASKEDMLKSFPTDTASGAVASFADGANVPVKSLIVNIDPVQEGSGDPSPTNVRTISGWSEVNVQRTGINIFDGEWEVGLISATTGQNTDDNNYCRTKNYLPVVPNSEVYCVPENKTLYFREYDANKNFIRYAQINSNNRLLMILPDTFFIRFCWDGNTYDGDISINYPPSDHSYHEPQLSTSLTIALGQTVYGGTLDVVSGVLTVDRAMVDLGDRPNWINYKTGGFRSLLDNAIAATLSVDDPNLITTMYKTYPSSATLTNGMASIANGSLYVVNSNFTTDVDGFKTAMTGQKAVYKLATPLTITLTPHEVRSLLGSNNVWADTGDTAVEYRADPTLYINKKITEAISALS